MQVVVMAVYKHQPLTAKTSDVDVMAVNLFSVFYKDIYIH